MEQQHAGFTQFSARGPPPASQQAAPVGGFDWSAPPFKAIPNEFGSMLPDVEIYGLKVPGVGLVAVAALGMFFGWRGLLGGLIFGESPAYTQHAPTAARASEAASKLHATGCAWVASLQIQSAVHLSCCTCTVLHMDFASKARAVISCRLRVVRPASEYSHGATLAAAAGCAACAAGYLYLTYGQGAAAGAAGQGRPAGAAGAAAAAGGGGGDNFMQQAFGSMMGSGGASPDSRGQAAGSARPAGAWAGKGRKLGSN